MTLTEEYQYLGRSNAVGCDAGWQYYLLLYGKTQPDIAAHSHRVSLKLRLVCDVESSFYRYATAGSLAVDGVTAQSWDWDLKPNEPWNTTALTEDGITYRRWVDLAEGTVAVECDYGSQKTVSLTGMWTMKSTSDSAWFPYTDVPARVAVEATLPAIAGAAAPSFSADAVDMGKPVTVYTNRPGEDFLCKLTYRCNQAQGVIATEAEDAVTWTPPLELAQQIPNTHRVTAVITCHTYQNGQLLGSKDNYLTLKVPEDVRPTVSAAWQDTTDAYLSFGTLVQNASALEVAITAAGAYGSTIKSTAVTLGGKPYAGQTLLDAGELSLQVVVTDSRDRTATWEQTLSVAEYQLPALTLTAHRCTADGTADDMGEYAKVTAEGSVTDLKGLNTPNITITWAGGSREFTQLPATAIVEAPSTHTMPITATLADRLYAVTRDMTLSTGYATLDFLAGGKGISMGCTATREGFDCAMPAYFAAGINGAHLSTRQMEGDELVILQPGGGEQSIFLFGMAGSQSIYGLLHITGSGAFWSGTGAVTATARHDGIVELALPAPTRGSFTALSAQPVCFL